MKRRTPPLPPASLRFMGDSDEGFVKFGDDAVAQLRQYAGLTERSRVVDIGCGYGRFAHGLLRWDAFKGRYRGMDILSKHVEWCRKNLGRRRFSFEHLDIKNDRYNKAGTLEATTVRLPVDDVSADLAVLYSVFTHMYPEEITHYLAEFRRFLAPGGRVNVTMFVMNPEWEELDKQGKCVYHLEHRLTDFARYMEKENPLHAVGYDETWIREQVKLAGLTLEEPILFGSWAGRQNVPTFQDTLILSA